MIRIDEDKINSEIEKRKPKTIVFNAPDGLLKQVGELASKVEEKYGVNSFIVAEPSYGSCDTVNDEAEKLGAEIAFHIGHKIAFDRLGQKTILVDAYEDVSFKEIIDQAIPTLKSFNKIGVCTISQYLHRLPEAIAHFKENGIDVTVGKGKGQLSDGQVFGCEFYPAYDIKDEVDAFVLLGQSRFHGIGIALATSKPTYMLDPYLMEVVDMKDLAEESWKRAILSIYKASEGRIFGLIVGLREGQFMPIRTLQLKKKLEDQGKKVRLLAMRNITEERLSVMHDIDAFIQTACPRISIDGYTFSKPVLSVPQAEALIEVLEGRDPGAYLEKSHWL